MLNFKNPYESLRNKNLALADVLSSSILSRMRAISMYISQESRGGEYTKSSYRYTVAMLFTFGLTFALAVVALGKC